MKVSAAAIFLVLAMGLAGCGGLSSVPPAPSPIPQAAPPPARPSTPIQLAVFTDPGSPFSTSDVRDVQEHIVRFNTADELIWTADGTRFSEYFVSGNLIAYHHKSDTFFQVRFGTREGERRAYLTWTDDRLRGAPATLLDISVDGRGDLTFAETDVPVPGTR
jgi:hypothetical protein